MHVAYVDRNTEAAATDAADVPVAVQFAELAGIAGLTRWISGTLASAISAT
jgi:hypothetical protein